MMAGTVVNNLLGKGLNLIGLSPVFVLFLLTSPENRVNVATPHI
jgi:hypothetical protein